MKFTKKSIILLASLAILAVGIIGGTIAFLVTSTEPVVNQFTIGNFATTIEETFNNNVKTDVSVKNNGDMDVYIRANVVITWTNDAGEVWNTLPVKNTDYTITWGNDKWVESGGFWYYTEKVGAGAGTGILITECKLIDGATPPSGYYLTVDIISQAIQADGVDSTGKKAVVAAWDVDPETLRNS